MKTVLQAITFLLIGQILVSSCQSNISLTKRHYRKGYYLTVNSGKHALPQKTTKYKAEHVEIVSPVLVSAPVQIPSQTATHRTAPPVVTPAVAIKIVAEKAATFKENVSSHRIVPVPAIPVFKDLRTITPVKTAMLHSRGDSDGLSLFWVVILVILILWLLGFLAGGFGLGGLINLLLLVALILLILWLVRII
jgi:hypothetical protein